MGTQTVQHIVQINDSTLYFTSCLQNQSKFYNDTHQHHIQLRSESSLTALLLKSVYEEGVPRRMAFTPQWALHAKPMVSRGGIECHSPSQTLPSALLGPQSPDQKAAVMWIWEGPSIGGVLGGQSGEVL